MDETHNNRTAALTWRPLALFALYRSAVATLLFAGFLAGNPLGVMNAEEPVRFTIIAAAYLISAILLLWAAWRRLRPFAAQVVGGVLFDIAAITGLTYTLGSQETALGVLLITAVAGGSLLVGVRYAAFFAATATLALFAGQMLAVLAGRGDADGYTQVALLGTGIFVISVTASLLARRARESEALAQERSVDVANLEALNAHIVQRLDIGVIAVDVNDRIRLANRTARPLTGDVAGTLPGLTERTPDLADALAQWRRHRGADVPATIGIGGEEYMPRFLPLGRRGDSGTLIFLESLTGIRAQVQQAKLASMGRLTASIAHEVRNPLGAMMQAAQLLGEAENLGDGEHRLLRIILKQGRRLNQTIENVLQLSRRSPPERQPVQLDAWAREVAEDWREQQGPALAADVLQLRTEPAAALFDPAHLQQVVENLLRNALEHGGDPPAIELATGRDERGMPFLDIADNGPGVTGEVRERLFEPFATGRRSGTGLGLYLARELCEANQARIELKETSRGACFRIRFARAPEEQPGANG